MERKLILFEVNEVPYRVLDKYCRDRPDSVLNRIMARSGQFETRTDDRLALDPWISWPTFHRGVNDETHGILHLGQPVDDADRKYPPIWKILKSAGLSVGIFGSLHSSQVPKDASSYSFYVPDYFGTDAFAHPRELIPFQQLNLAMTRASARNVSRSIPGGALKVMASLLRLGVRNSTVIDLFSQLLSEVWDKTLRIRRRTYQALVMGDLFIHQMERTKPQFATFYTNHVAAAMHRYWGASFPEDYAQPLDEQWIRKYAGEITFAMDKLDAVLGNLVRFVDKHPEYSLMVASSMGQAAIPAQKTFDFVTVTDLAKFMANLGAPVGTWEGRPAMVPCQSVVVDAAHIGAVRDSLETMVIGGVAAVRDQRPIAPFSYDEAQTGSFQFFIQFDNYRGLEEAALRQGKISFADLGLGLMQHEDGVNCTAQHVAAGSLFVYGAGLAREKREAISTNDVVPSILRYFGIEPPAYLPGNPTVRFAV